MLEVQKFALGNIHCSPSQDKQYRIRLVKVTKSTYPARGSLSIYNRRKNLPDSTSNFHVFVIGNVDPNVLNLMKKRKSWVRDVWYNVEEDMNARSFVMQFYDCDGIVFPRRSIYYSIGNDDLTIAIKSDGVMRKFNVDDCAFMRVYSNENFNSNLTTDGIYCESLIVRANTDKANLQTKIQQLEANGGKTLVYVDGYYTNSVTLDIPNESLVEIVYDKSILSKELIRIGDMRTYHSTKDSRVKYLAYRDRVVDTVQYEDDLEVYITGDVGGTCRGLYYYQHKDHAVTNVTDKDFGLDTNFVNSQATTLMNEIGGSIGDKYIAIHTRRSSYDRGLVYSSIKLHELYKLPHSVQKDVLSNTNYTISNFRVETLEDSAYFKIASAKSLKTITKELATEAVGYNGVSYYYGMTPSPSEDLTDVPVPFLYRRPSTIYEYDNRGFMLGHYPTVGPMCNITNAETSHVEFIQGRNIGEMKLYNPNEDIPLEPNKEYRVVSAAYQDNLRITVWEDITESPSTIKSTNSVKVVNDNLGRIRVVYLEDIILQDLELSLSGGVMLFPLEVQDDRDGTVSTHRLDLPFDSLEVFLNGRRLTYEVDFRIDFPNVVICNKTYIDYTLPSQKVHVRLSGFNLELDKINAREIRGFVSHGALTRNSYYDIRDDKVFSIFINGKLTPRHRVNFSDEDNTVRLNHPLNGVPYTVKEPMLSIEEITGISTLGTFNSNTTLNERISGLYDIVYPEPTVDNFNVIGDHHYLYSTLVTKLIHDLISGVLESSIYTNPYNDNTIQTLINDRYKLYYDLDPIRTDYPYNLIEIHPHSGNSTIEMSLFQYRFLTNVVRIITGGKPERINLSGYLTVNAELGVDSVEGKTDPGGVVVI